MKEDILEQLVDEYLQHKGYFTRHNLKFRPDPGHPEYEKSKDCVYSDIDILAVHPKARGAARVWAVSCKSWQQGFSCASKLAQLQDNKTVSGREAWKQFRELVVPKWTTAFLAAIEAATGSRRFTYVTAVTRVRGERTRWESHPPFREALGGNPVRLLSLSEILADLYPALRTTPASSHVGRLLQLVKASGWRPSER